MLTLKIHYYSKATKYDLHFACESSDCTQVVVTQLIMVF